MYATKKHVEKVKKEIIETMKKEFEEIQKKQDESWNKRLDEIRKELVDKTQSYVESEEFQKNLSNLQEKEADEDYIEEEHDTRKPLKQIEEEYRKLFTGIWNNKFIRMGVDVEEEKKEPFKVKKGNWVYMENDVEKIAIVFATSNVNNTGSFKGFGYNYGNKSWEKSEGFIWFWDSECAKRNATEKEVVDIIENEIKKRYKVGDIVKCAYDGEKIEIKDFCIDRISLIEDGEIWVNNGKLSLMDEGKWAEIIEEEKPVTDKKYQLTEKEITEVFKSWETNVRLHPKQHISNTGEIDIETISKQYTDSFLKTLKSIRNEIY